jgi:hypothetical protein
MEGILDRPLIPEEFDIEEIIMEVQYHYAKRWLTQTGGVMAKAAKGFFSNKKDPRSSMDNLCKKLSQKYPDLNGLINRHKQ